MERRCVIAFVLASLGVGAANSTPCALPGTSSGTVTAVRDGRTLELADGRDVRLAFIEGTDRGADALRTLVNDRTLRLDHATPGTDRYGRLVAFATLPGAAQSVQETLLAQGDALVSARIGSKTCAEALLAAERAARTARRGLWADPNFAPLSSENLAGLEAARGHFALVEGRVLSVRESGATIYVNFGRRWTRDFTVTVLKREQRTFAGAGLDLKQLEGRRIRVRGWVEQRGGPIIEAAVPEQIELID